MSLSRFVVALCLFLALLGSISTGCGGADPRADVTAQRNATNIQKVASAYVLFLELHSGKPPESKNELMEYITTYEKIRRNLDMMGIDPATFGDCFVSKLDDEDFTVRWGVKFNPERASVPLVFERTGVDGVRRVALSDSRVLEVSDQGEYDQLLAGKISKDDAGEDAAIGGEADEQE